MWLTTNSVYGLGVCVHLCWEEVFRMPTFSSQARKQGKLVLEKTSGQTGTYLSHLQLSRMSGTGDSLEWKLIQTPYFLQTATNYRYIIKTKGSNHSLFRLEKHRTCSKQSGEMTLKVLVVEANLLIYTYKIMTQCSRSITQLSRNLRRRSITEMHELFKRPGGPTVWIRQSV